MAAPVAIVSNTTYVASYFSPLGYFALDRNAFNTAGVDNPPLHALASGVDGPNGVYRYDTSGFPIDGGSNNYWVDVVFTTTVIDVTPPVITNVNAMPGSGGTALITWSTDEVSDSRVDYGIAPDSLTLSATNASLVMSHAITLTGLMSNTTYYYRVTSAEWVGNASTYPAVGEPLAFTITVDIIAPTEVPVTISNRACALTRGGSSSRMYLMTPAS